MTAPLNGDRPHPTWIGIAMLMSDGTAMTIELDGGRDTRGKIEAGLTQPDPKALVIPGQTAHTYGIKLDFNGGVGIRQANQPAGTRWPISADAEGGAG